MKKQEYQKPAMLVIMTDLEQQILAGSVSAVKTTGLDEDLNKDDNPGDIWNEAMSRRHTVWDEDEEE
jgi:hypothetical protein